MAIASSTSRENLERILGDSNANNNPINHNHNTLSASTDIVHAIFGPSVGPCRAAFACNYQRIHGRLYLSTKAVLFYSILFGYERRLCLPLSDITELTTYRTSSIRIEMVDCEVHIFKTLKDRDHVFQLIFNLKRSLSLPHQIPNEIGFLPQLQPSNGSYDEDDNNSATILKETESSTQVLTAAMTIPPAALPLRQRSISLPVVLGSISESQEILETNFRKRSDGDLDSSSSDSQGMHQLAAWGVAKQKKFEDIAVDSVTLPCSLDKFFDTFLADQAPHSLDSFQRNVIGDTEVDISAWELQRGRDLLVRTTNCLHKLKNSLGPSHAKTTRHQRLQRFGELGITVESTISVAGVPASDILKGIIQSSTRTETKLWFASYVKMMQTALSRHGSERSTAHREDLIKVLGMAQSLDAVNRKLERIVVTGVAIAAVIFVALLLQTLCWHRAFLLLREELTTSRLEAQAICQYRHL